MTEKEIHEFAKQADLCWTNGQPMIEIHLLERFAGLVAVHVVRQLTGQGVAPSVRGVRNE